LPGVEWGANNTFQEDDANATADGTGDNQDEDRVFLVTAHWVMDQ